MRLTKTAVERLPLPETGQKLVWDDVLKGFGVRLTRGSRSYVVESRVDGRTRRVTLGAHGVLTAEQARTRAKKALGAMADGKDPNTEKKAARARSVTLRECMEDYIRDHRGLKQSSIESIRKQVLGKKPRKNIEPAISFKAWADQPVGGITRTKVQAHYRKMAERSPAQANQAFRILRALLNYSRAAYRAADDSPILSVENPVSVLSDAGLWANVDPKRRRVPPERIGAAWALLESLREDPVQTAASRTGADIAAFLLLTGARWGEAAQLTWDRVNLGDGSWHLPDPKNRRAVTLPLSDAACAVLGARADYHDSVYVFPARAAGGYIHDARRTFERLSEVAGGRVSPHDLRRSFRAVAEKCGIELWKTKLLMNHASTDVTIKHYTETGDLRDFKPESDKIGRWIGDAARVAKAPNVVRIRA